MHRNRFVYFGLILLTIACGLASRTSIIPNLIYPYLGDALYATMSFFIFGWLLQKQKTLTIALTALVFCFLIETAQLIQADWLIAIRTSRVGALVLGSGFLWSDLVAYVFGVMLGAMVEILFIKKER